MSVLLEQAGGSSSTGGQRVLDLVPTKIHQRAPIYLGCKRDVELLLQFSAAADAEALAAGAGGSK